MARLIDADIFIRDLTAMKKIYDAIELDGMIKALKEAPTIDPLKNGYVLSGVLDQVRWERDIAMSYLEEAGVAFGEKAELQRVKHGKWKPRGQIDRYSRCYECTVCKERVWLTDMVQNCEFKYCPNCGSRMEGE